MALGGLHFSLQACSQVGCSGGGPQAGVHCMRRSSVPRCSAAAAAAAAAAACSQWQHRCRLSPSVSRLQSTACPQMVRLHDRDNSGTISLDEFRTLHLQAGLLILLLAGRHSPHAGKSTVLGAWWRCWQHVPLQGDAAKHCRMPVTAAPAPIARIPNHR